VMVALCLLEPCCIGQAFPLFPRIIPNRLSLLCWASWLFERVYIPNHSRIVFTHLFRITPHDYVPSVLGTLAIRKGSYSALSPARSLPPFTIVCCPCAEGFGCFGGLLFNIMPAPPLASLPMDRRTIVRFPELRETPKWWFFLGLAKEIGCVAQSDSTSRTPINRVFP